MRTEVSYEHSLRSGAKRKASVKAFTLRDNETVVILHKKPSGGSERIVLPKAVYRQLIKKSK